MANLVVVEEVAVLEVVKVVVVVVVDLRVKVKEED